MVGLDDLELFSPHPTALSCPSQRSLMPLALRFICSPQKESGKTDVTKLSNKIKKNILALFCTSHLNENELEISDTYSQAGLGIGLMHRGT